MKAIYKPRGKAAEYAPLAVNLYDGCSHGCTYCYAPGVLRRDRKHWIVDSPVARKDILNKLSEDVLELQCVSSKQEILLCFTCDPYHSGDTSITRRALQIIGKNGLNATVLTKGGMRAARDFNILSAYNFRFGSTLCFVDDAMRAKWEPGAPSISDRIEAIRQAHGGGIRTWVSLEPVIDAEQALGVIREIHPYVDFWFVGKANHVKLETPIDWPVFRRCAEAVLKSCRAKYRFKREV